MLTPDCHPRLWLGQDFRTDRDRTIRCHHAVRAYAHTTLNFSPPLGHKATCCRPKYWVYSERVAVTIYTELYGPNLPFGWHKISARPVSTDSHIVPEDDRPLSVVLLSSLRLRSLIKRLVLRQGGVSSLRAGCGCCTTSLVSRPKSYYCAPVPTLQDYEAPLSLPAKSRSWAFGRADEPYAGKVKNLEVTMAELELAGKNLLKILGFFQKLKRDST